MGRFRAETVDDRIRKAGWFKGTDRDWQSLDIPTRESLAFAGCGCAVAYPTWEGPVDCVHSGCQVLRGEIHPLIVTNRILKYETQSGWLRFGKESTEGRIRTARLIRSIRNAALASGIYDPWKIPGAWGGIVGVALA